MKTLQEGGLLREEGMGAGGSIEMEVDFEQNIVWVLQGNAKGENKKDVCCYTLMHKKLVNKVYMCAREECSPV